MEKKPLINKAICKFSWYFHLKDPILPHGVAYIRNSNVNTHLNRKAHRTPTSQIGAI